MCCVLLPTNLCLLKATQSSVLFFSIASPCSAERLSQSSCLWIRNLCLKHYELIVKIIFIFKTPDRCFDYTVATRLIHKLGEFGQVSTPSGRFQHALHPRHTLCSDLLVAFLLWPRTRVRRLFSCGCQHDILPRLAATSDTVFGKAFWFNTDISDSSVLHTLRWPQPKPIGQTYIPVPYITTTCRPWWPLSVSSNLWTGRSHI